MSLRIKLRTKFLMTLLGLSVAPLLLTLLLISEFTGRLLHRDMLLMAEKTGNFVERSTASSQREIANYIALLCSSADVVNATYYASLTDEVEQLQELVADARSRYDFDVLEARTPEGGLLARSHRDSVPLPAAAGDGHPVLKASLSGEAGSAIGVFAERSAIIVASPIQLQGRSVGHLLGVNFLDDAFAAHIKNLSGAEIAFVNGEEIVATSHEQLKTLTGELREEGRTVLLDKVPHALFFLSLDGQERGVILALDRSLERQSRQSLGKILGTLAVLAALLALATGLLFSARMVRPLTDVVGSLKEIAEGEGDLTRRLEVASGDEVGELAASFNGFIARLREMVRRTRDVSGDVTEATDRIRLSSAEVKEGAVRQSASLEESFRALQGIEEAVSGIAESTGGLLNAAEASSSAAVELGATVEEIADQMEKLFCTVEDVSSSIGEMSVSSQQITENVEILTSSTAETASSILELDTSIEEIKKNAEETNRLSEEAAANALEGKRAVEESIAGISGVRETVERAGVAIRELGDQSKDIGRILTVIDEVADQTSLLALNAAIIAAQAGEHGKGFAVVADEIRELADRTAVSTREIAVIIGKLQTGTQEAVKAMNTGSERVHQEVERSRTAGAVLEKIRTSTLKSSDQVRSIVRATQEQSRGSRRITDSINQVTSLLGQIASAIRQQTEGTGHLAKASESMKAIAAHVKLSTGEQARGSHQIAASMEKIRQMIEQIDTATRDQTRRSQQVVEAVSKIRTIAEQNATRAVEFDQVVETLAGQAAQLDRETGAFRA